MILTHKSIEKILYIVTGKSAFMQRHAPQEIDRISDVVLKIFESLLQNENVDAHKNKLQWIELFKNRLTEELDSISNFVGVKELGSKLNVSDIVNLIYDVEFNTEEFLKQNTKT